VCPSLIILLRVVILSSLRVTTSMGGMTLAVLFFWEKKERRVYELQYIHNKKKVWENNIEYVWRERGLKSIIKYLLHLSLSLFAWDSTLPISQNNISRSLPTQPITTKRLIKRERMEGWFIHNFLSSKGWLHSLVNCNKSLL